MQHKQKEKKAIITVKGLQKSFSTGEVEQVIINNLDLDIYEGDFTIIMGSSGAGKSTLMYALSGMDRPSGGRILFDGKDITEYKDDELAVFRRKNCGFVFQQIYLLEKMSLMDNVLTTGFLTGEKKNNVIKRAEDLFDKVNLPKITRKKNSSQISGGEAQRVGIVRALINRPKVVFADEPTGALNSNNSDAVLDVFSKVHEEGQSIIMVTHDKKTALRADRIIYLKDGKIFGECLLGNYQKEDVERTRKLNQFLEEMGW
ncbi:MAG: ABC transporter ATP-binding protein [Lachnospiraceae bacterium]|nr:ABC transporter ATP-binding protein [Lachnospiraceae bacterium]